MTDLKNKILDKIQTGEAKMRPRWHFILKAILAAVGSVVIFAILIYLFSFVVFILHDSGAWFAPAFGSEGIGIFLASLPWTLIFVGIIFVVILETLIRRYSFAYRKPLLYSLSGIVLFVAVMGSAVYQTPLHDNLLLKAEEGRLPLAEELYRGYTTQPIRKAHTGIIKKINDKEFKVEGRIKNGDDDLTIKISPKTKFPAGQDFKEDDRVLIVGNKKDRVIEAVGVLKVKDKRRINSDQDRKADKSEEENLKKIELDLNIDLERQILR